MKLRWYHTVVLIAGIGFPGCQKQGPVDLIDNEPPPADLVVAGTSTLPDGAFGTDDIDTARLFPPLQSSGLGQLMVSGSVFDSRTEHHHASLVRAIFFDRSAPVIINGDTAGYKTLNAGTVKLDDIPLFITAKRLRLPLLSLDSLLGVQYSLVNKDGVGGRGFQFVGSHAYQWQVSGSAPISAFTVDLTSPSEIHVESPTPAQTISLSHNLRVLWTGGGSTVDILVSDLQGGVRARPLVRLRLKSNQGGTLIPSAVLQILRGRRIALFSFTSGSTFQTTAPGYPDQIMVTASSTHNVAFSLSP